MGEASIFMQQFLRKLENVATLNACPKKDRQDLGIRKRVDASLEKFLPRFLLIRQFAYGESAQQCQKHAQKLLGSNRKLVYDIRKEIADISHRQRVFVDR